MRTTEPTSVAPLGDSVAAVAFLQSTSLCRDLPDDAMQDLYRVGEVVAFHAADVILAQGEHDDALFVIVEGNVTVQQQVDGAWVHLADLERPAVFGEMAVLTRQPRTAAVVSTTDCQLIRLPGETVRAVADGVPKFGKRLAMLMSARSKDTDRKQVGRG